MESQLTFFPWLQTIYEVEKFVFCQHIFDIQHQPYELLDIGLYLTSVPKSQQLISCDPLLISWTKLCLQVYLHLFLDFDLLYGPPSCQEHWNIVHLNFIWTFVQLLQVLLNVPKKVVKKLSVVSTIVWLRFLYFDPHWHDSWVISIRKILFQQCDGVI